jgi:hypothetical protein
MLIAQKPKAKKNFGYQSSQKMASINSTILHSHQSVPVLIVVVIIIIIIIHSTHIQNSHNLNAALLCNNGCKWIKSQGYLSKSYQRMMGKCPFFPLNFQ